MDTDLGDLMLIRQFDFDVCSSAKITSFTLRFVACDDLQNSTRYERCPLVTCTIFLIISSTPGLCEIMFEEKNYTINVSELALPESELLQVRCAVPGGGPLQQHTIEIIPPNPGLSQILQIDNDHVILQELLDYELQQNLTVHLNCSDSGGQVSIASQFVQVLTENDNSSYFKKSLYIFNVNQVNSIPMIIGYITAAMDDDKGLNNILMFSLSLKEDNDSLREYIILNLTGGNKTVGFGHDQLSQTQMKYT